ncbi:sensor histidine kinase [Janthinobacterium agaricidamnosum]|uniref:histidine kinase n=1 Tax=Janthinobacterium agaricidamnosum NBRC 102515 = DSM 9628 TaxID=1349767 RepID=W0V6G9_9BURK|nr:HAMP domain-containing sensor histidine kinase [Janthinobacterium agaricidamnosum]CDG83210.1 HAMP domain protein [Janthinobacterium agaricidamnosum NBRC 102515 = DSM 9628]
MFRLRASIAAKLVIGYGLLATASIMVVSAVFYVGTIGVLDRNIDSKVSVLSDRLILQYQGRPDAELISEVRHQLTDGIDNDREIFLVLDAEDTKLAGNLTPWPMSDTEIGVLYSREVARDGSLTPARLLIRRLGSGGLLVVGSDLSEQEAVRALVWRALVSGAALSLLLTVIGAWLFRAQIEGRIGQIRRTALEIGAGDLSRRIPVSDTVSEKDEFNLLNRDINRMLDRIEQLMEGIRHVSNAIAHDLRTPLGRVRSKLDEALRHDMTVHAWAGTAQNAIDDIDDLIRLFERLLQIAEAESGMRGHLFEALDLNRIALDIVEMYEASAEERDIRLGTALLPQAMAYGDRNLLASAIASLIDNAIKYAGPGASVEVRTSREAGQVAIAVCDNGPGIPGDEFDKVTQRFYRLDKSRSLPGNGLGLSIVHATASLHGGRFVLSDAAPGLIASIFLPLDHQ